MTITQTSISTFLDLQDAIKAEALRINNLLSGDFSDYAPRYCGIIPEDLDMRIEGEDRIFLEYVDPYENFQTDTWTIPVDYIGMSDEEILAIVQEEWENLAKAHREREVACLKRQAEMFGYELKEKGE